VKHSLVKPSTSLLDLLEGLLDALNRDGDGDGELLLVRVVGVHGGREVQFGLELDERAVRLAMLEHYDLGSGLQRLARLGADGGYRRELPAEDIAVEFLDSG
jgi:hypothetical protein